MAGDPHRQNKCLFGPRYGFSVLVDRAVVIGFLVGEHVTFEADLDRPRPHVGVDLPVHPHRSLEKTSAGSRLDGLEIHNPAVTIINDGGSAQPECVVLGKLDVCGQRGDLLRLDQRDLGHFSGTPLDPGDVEVRPNPVIGFVTEEELAIVRQLDGTLLSLKPEGETPGRLVVAQAAILVVLEGLESADDLLHRHLTATTDIDLLVESLEFGSAGSLETQDGHIGRIADHDDKIPVLPDTRHRSCLAGLQIHQLGRTQLLIREDQSQPPVSRFLFGHDPEPEIFPNKGPGPVGPLGI